MVIGWRTLVGCGATLLAGCTLALAGDLDDVRAESAAPDGGNEGGSPGTADASGDVSASTDAGPVEAGPQRGCAAYQPAPRFCDDFDRPTGLTTWKVERENGDSVVQSEQAFSGPSAAKVTVNNVPGGDCLYSRIERTFENVSPNHVTVTLRLRLGRPWPDGMIPVVLDLVPSTSAAYCAALFYVDAPSGEPSSAQLNVQSNTKPNNMGPIEGYPSANEWSEMKIDVTRRDAGGANIETTFVDPSGYSVSSKRSFPECPVWDTLRVRLGAHCDHRGATVYFDDVRVDWD